MQSGLLKPALEDGTSEPPPPPEVQVLPEVTHQPLRGLPRVRGAASSLSPAGRRPGLPVTGSGVRALPCAHVPGASRDVLRGVVTPGGTVTAPGRSLKVQVGAAQQLLPGTGPNSRRSMTTY